jgi:hypothetical protein
MSEYYRARILREIKGKEMTEEIIFEINGRNVTILSCTPDENVQYLASKIEQITEEEAGILLRKDLDYNPNLESDSN